MSRQIYVNLPVKNLERTKAFFGSLGFNFNPQFTKWTISCERRSLPAARRPIRLKTTASCTAMVSRTSTAMCGS